MSKKGAKKICMMMIWVVDLLSILMIGLHIWGAIEDIIYQVSPFDTWSFMKKVGFLYNNDTVLLVFILFWVNVSVGIIKLCKKTFPYGNNSVKTSIINILCIIMIMTSSHCWWEGLMSI